MLQSSLYDRRTGPQNSAYAVDRGAAGLSPVLFPAGCGRDVGTGRAALRVDRARDGAVGRLDHAATLGIAVVRKATAPVLDERRRFPFGPGAGSRAARTSSSARHCLPD